jgi:hypothetical protein
VELPPILPDEGSPDVPAAEPAPPAEPPSLKPLPGIVPAAPEVLPELLPELPPEGGVVVVPGLVSLSAGGGVDGVDGVDGVASGAVCAGDTVVPGPACSVPPPPPPRLQAARLIAIKLDTTRIFEICNFGFIPIPFNYR